MKKNKHIDDGVNGIRVPLKTDKLHSQKVATTRGKVGEALCELRTYEQLRNLIISVIRNNGFKLENAHTKEDVVHDVVLSFLKSDDESIEDIFSLMEKKERPVIELKKGYPESLKNQILRRTINNCIDIYRYEQRRRYATPEDVSPVNWLEYWDDWQLWATWKPGNESGIGIKLQIEKEPNKNYIPKRLPRFSVSEKEQPTVDKLSLEEVLNMLLPGERCVFKLIYEGYKHKEIAEKLEITSDASRKRLERARVRLQSIYPQEFVVE